jgi:hypothetical protein
MPSARYEGCNKRAEQGALRYSISFTCSLGSVARLASPTRWPVRAGIGNHKKKQGSCIGQCFIVTASFSRRPSAGEARKRHAIVEP